jgi:hypothetical protein
MKGQESNCGEDPKSKHLRRYQFRLSSLLMAVTTSAILFGLWMWINFRLDHNLRDFFHMGAFFFLVCSPVVFCVIPRRFLGYLWIAICFSSLIGFRKLFSLGGLYILGAGVWSIAWGAPISLYRLRSSGRSSPWLLVVVVVFVAGVMIYLFVVPALSRPDT